MANSGSPSIPATGTAAPAIGSNALHRRERRPRDPAELPSPPATESSASSESGYSPSAIAEVEARSAEVMRQHAIDTYYKPEPRIWRGLWDLQPVDWIKERYYTKDGRRKTLREIKRVDRCEDDHLMLEQVEPRPEDNMREQDDQWDEHDRNMMLRNTYYDEEEDMWKTQRNTYDEEVEDMWTQRDTHPPSLSGEDANADEGGIQGPTDVLSPSSSSSSSSSSQHTPQQDPPCRTSPPISKRSATTKSTTIPTLASAPTNASTTETPPILKPRATRGAAQRISKPSQRQLRTRGRKRGTGRGRGHKNDGKLWELDERGMARRSTR